jgi:chaperonin cofactor prefoldin
MAVDTNKTVRVMHLVYGLLRYRPHVAASVLLLVQSSLAASNPGVVRCDGSFRIAGTRVENCGRRVHEKMITGMTAGLGKTCKRGWNCARAVERVMGLTALRGGADIAPEYLQALQSSDPTQVGSAVGSIDRDDVGSQLPWPEGSEGKKESFLSYQREYSQLKDEVQGTVAKLQLADQQQKIHKITLKALHATPENAETHIPYGRLYLRKPLVPLRDTLQYQSEKVLEETICELSDERDRGSARMRELEKSMQELLNHVFRGRFQLFMDSSGGG